MIHLYGEGIHQSVRRLDNMRKKKARLLGTLAFLRLPHTRAIAVAGAMAVAVTVAIKSSHTNNAVVAISLKNRVSTTS
jgi:hypothetical protein